MKQFIVIALLFVLCACGTEIANPSLGGARVSNSNGETYPQVNPNYPEENDAATRRPTNGGDWPAVTRFTVQGSPTDTSVVKFGVAEDAKNETSGCRVIRHSAVIPRTAKWNPLPMILETPSLGTILSKVFEATLDFNQIDPDGLDFRVDFVRGKDSQGHFKVFRSLWQLKAFRNGSNCEGYAAFCNNLERVNDHYVCRGEYSAAREIQAVVDKVKHIFQMAKPEREIDDLKELRITSEPIRDGIPAGATTTETIPVSAFERE